MDTITLIETLARDLRIGIRVGLIAGMCYTSFMMLKLTTDLLVNLLLKFTTPKT